MAEDSNDADERNFSWNKHLVKIKTNRIGKIQKLNTLTQNLFNQIISPEFIKQSDVDCQTEESQKMAFTDAADHVMIKINKKSDNEKNKQADVLNKMPSLDQIDDSYIIEAQATHSRAIDAQVNNNQICGYQNIKRYDDNQNNSYNIGNAQAAQVNDKQNNDDQTTNRETYNNQNIDSPINNYQAINQELNNQIIANQFILLNQTNGNGINNCQSNSNQASYNEYYNQISDEEAINNKYNNNQIENKQNNNMQIDDNEVPDFQTPLFRIAVSDDKFIACDEYEADAKGLQKNSFDSVSLRQNDLVVIIDAYGLFFRSYYSMPDLQTSSGIHIGAVYGFINTLFSVIKPLKCTHLLIALDHQDKSKRHEFYNNYKANRSTAPDNLISQFPLLMHSISVMEAASMAISGYEADDIIATIAIEAAKKSKVLVVSSDKDLLQLVNDGKIEIYDPVKKKIFHEKDVVEKFGIKSCFIADYLALVGDASDNIPGVPSIGPKTAAELINQLGSIEEIYNNLSLIKNEKVRNILEKNKDKAELSKNLTSLKTVEWHNDFKKFRFNGFNAEGLEEISRQYDFRFLKNLEKYSCIINPATIKTTQLNLL